MATRKYPTQLANKKARKSAPATGGMKKPKKYRSISRIERISRPASGGVKSKFHRMAKELARIRKANLELLIWLGYDKYLSHEAVKNCDPDDIVQMLQYVQDAQDQQVRYFIVY